MSQRASSARSLLKWRTTHKSEQTMKRKIAAYLIACLTCGLTAQAANIAWVSFHPADNQPSAAAAAAGFTNAPDAGYTTLLASKGHTVTRFVSVEAVDQNPDLLMGLNTNDLVIISRSVPSAHYDSATETAMWNGVTSRMIVMGGYITRAARLGFTTGDTMVDANSASMRLKINSSLHPIFAGVAVDANNLMVNPYSTIVTYTNSATGATNRQLGISVNNNTLPAGGTVLAVVGTAGDAAINGMVIAEYPTGTLLNSRDYLPSGRLVVLSGSRESGITSEGSGIYDLADDGEKIFLNAVNYMLTEHTPAFTAPLLSGTNLVAGDRWTFAGGAIGEPPIDFQWYRNGQPVADATTATLAIASLQNTDAGEWYVVASNALGMATSSVATLEFAVFPTPNLTNSIISYWPMDTILGTKTPDLVSSYDLTMVNMGPANLVNGRWGKAMLFNNPSSTILEREDNPGENLPISAKTNFTISMWVNGPVQPDRRIFSEGSHLQNNTLFNLGTHNGGTDGTLDVYIRSDAGTLALDHVHSTAIAYDDTWHHIAYVQRQVGDGLMRAFVYIDGAQDPMVIAPIRPLTATRTSIGGILRAGRSAFFTGMIDEVAVWDRALSPQEIQILQTTAITNPPSNIQPLRIDMFRADLPAVVKGGSTVLRWDMSKNVSQVTIDKLGDVTGKTTAGAGTEVVTLNETTTYVLTASRGVDTLTATTTVAVVEGVAAGWTLLDNFDRYSPGPLNVPKYWTDATGDSAQFVNYMGNMALKPTTGSSVAVLNLKGLSVNEGEIATLFFRIITGTNNAAGITNIVGLTDKVQRSYGDAYQNLGPVVYASALTNDVWAIDTNAWYLGARNGYQGNNVSNPIDYPAQPLRENSVYNVWIDVSNNNMNEYMPDIFSVYIQKVGETGRTLLFQDYSSDRDFFYVEPVLGGMLPNLDKLVVLGNNGALSALFDDFYLSKGAYNATVPRAYEFTGPAGPLPALQIVWSGAQLDITWTEGVLQEASSPTGEWADVTGAAPPSYKVTPTAGTKFYRTRR